MSKASSEKTDAMRKHREAQYERQQAEAKARARAAKLAPPDPPSGVGTLDNEASTPALPAPSRKPATRASASGAPARLAAPARTAVASSFSVGADGKRAPKAGEGRCAACGKLKTLDGRGRIPAHQKGMGKACAGSGKAAA